MTKLEINQLFDTIMEHKTILSGHNILIQALLIA